MAAAPRTSPRLGELLRRRTEELAAAALADDGIVDEAQLEALERLSKLHEIAHSLYEPRRHRLWTAAALVVAIAVVLGLYAKRDGSTSVSGELLVRELSMELGGPPPVIPGSGLTRLSIAGLDSVRLPVGDDSYRVMPATSLTLQVSAAGAGTVDMEEWPLSAGTALGIRVPEGSGSYEWIVDPPTGSRPAEVRATVSGPVVATVNGGRPIPLTTRYGALVEAYAKEEEQLYVTTAYADTAARGVMPVPVAHALSFDRRLRYRNDYRELSSVLGGSVTLDDLGAREIKLGPGQSLRFSGSRMEIPHLALERGGIRLRFSGRVEGMSTGTGRRRNLMPRVLERLAGGPAYLLIGSAVLTVFGYLLGLRRFFSR